ncbi:hypothetical protein ACFE04_025969 [Oxalis oulophora]
MDMDKEENFEPNFTSGLGFSHQQVEPFMKSKVGESSSGENHHNNNTNNTVMFDYMLQQNSHHHHHQQQQQFLCATSSSPFDNNKLMSFADVMQFADFGPKLALNQTKTPEEVEDSAIDPVYFLKFPVLNDINNTNQQYHHHQPISSTDQENEERFTEEMAREDEEDLARVSDSNDTSAQRLRFLGEEDINLLQQNEKLGHVVPEVNNNKNKRKRPKTIKTTEEVESQRMTHIAVERNRRKQMNEHLRVLRSLMPGSYVQRGDQASIIGGAIEFVRELEQLLQCLESQKRRRIFGEAAPSMGNIQQPNDQSPFLAIPQEDDQLIKVGTLEGGSLSEETAESKSCLADVEVKVLGFDAMIKVLSRRRPGQLIKTIAALEDMQLNILHTNITTIEQTVLYSFNVKVESESRYTAEDIASSVQQIISFIHGNNI